MTPIFGAAYQKRAPEQCACLYWVGAANSVRSYAHEPPAAMLKFAHQIAKNLIWHMRTRSRKELRRSHGALLSMRLVTPTSIALKAKRRPHTLSMPLHHRELRQRRHAEEFRSFTSQPITFLTERKVRPISNGQGGTTQSRPRKLAGEQGVRAANPKHIILRTSWLYSPYRKNFVRTILRLAREREQLTIVADQRGCPTAARDLAEACLDIAERCAAAPMRAPYGTYHYAGAGETTWFEFAQAIVEMVADRLRVSPRIVPIRTAEYPTPATRAADTRLDWRR